MPYLRLRRGLRLRGTMPEDMLCSNCLKPIPTGAALSALVVQRDGRRVAVICLDCQQQARKIQITLRKIEGGWEYFQFFPVET